MAPQISFFNTVFPLSASTTYNTSHPIFSVNLKKTTPTMPSENHNLLLTRTYTLSSSFFIIQIRYLFSLSAFCSNKANFCASLLTLSDILDKAIVNEKRITNEKRNPQKKIILIGNVIPSKADINSSKLGKAVTTISKSIIKNHGKQYFISRLFLRTILVSTISATIIKTITIICSLTLILSHSLSLLVFSLFPYPFHQNGKGHFYHIVYCFLQSNRGHTSLTFPHDYRYLHNFHSSA